MSFTIFPVFDFTSHVELTRFIFTFPKWIFLHNKFCTAQCTRTQQLAGLFLCYSVIIYQAVYLYAKPYWKVPKIWRFPCYGKLLNFSLNSTIWFYNAFQLEIQIISLTLYIWSKNLYFFISSICLTYNFKRMKRKWHTAVFTCGEK